MLTIGEVLDATHGRLSGARAAAPDLAARFSRVVVDSRAVVPGALFVALKGERHDAHAFVDQAFAGGALAALVERVPDVAASAPGEVDRQGRSGSPLDAGDTPLDGGDTPLDGGGSPLDGEDTPVDAGDTPLDGGATPPDGRRDRPLQPQTPGSPPTGPGTPLEEGIRPRDGGDAPREGGAIPPDGRRSSALDGPGSARGEGLFIVVPSTAQALADMARYALGQHPSLRVVGITGSLGKTTTKEVTAGVLATRWRVLKTEGNLNSEIGLPMTVLNGLSPDQDVDVAVLEMAMYQPGDIRFLARLVHPSVGVVTAVQPVHLERMGTIDRIQQAKQELVEELPTDGVAVLNGDDPLVSRMAAATSARVVRYGVAESAAVRAEAIQSRGLQGVEFDLLYEGQRQRVHLPLLGAHSVLAALAATAVALEHDLTLSEIAHALAALSPALRQLVIDGINGSRILDDSYNASPESMLAALTLLGELPGERKLAVLGDMLELGSAEESGHRRVGQHAASVADVVVTFGERARLIADEARRAGASVTEGTSHEAIVALLRSELRPGDDVLVKGSLAMGMSAIVRGIAPGEG